MKNPFLKIIKYCVLGLLVLVGLSLTVILGAGYFVTLPDRELTSAGHPRNMSKYVTMRDGVKIAIDIWFPKDMAANQKYPTALHMTRYWRDKDKTLLQRGLIALDVGVGKITDILDIRTSWFNDADYVVIKVDGRGSGASFGVRPVEWSPDEITDYGEILDWIGQQDWSNGNVGSFGISYNGNTAEMIITTNRPELKVAAPLYDDFNPFLGLVQPGGAQNVYLDGWGKATYQMDQNDICSLADAEGLKCLLVKSLISGVKPVEGEEDQLKLALEDHKNNFSMEGSDKNTQYLDDSYGTSGYASKDIAPFGHRAEIEKTGVPMIIHAGWLDAATVEGALNRYLTFSNDQHLLIGPFTHGGSMDTDPFKDVGRPVSPSGKEQYDTLISYFDKFLKENKEGLTPAKQITYYTLNADKWSTTEIWPPEGFTDRVYYFGDKNSLVENPENVAIGTDEYTVDFAADNGTTTRWHTNFGGGDVVYPNRKSEDEKLLTYTTAPLDQAIEITGTGVISLKVSSSHKDNMFIAYLEDIAPDGTVTYITEGVIRADNRKLADETKLLNKVVGVAHSYLREDAAPMVPDEMTDVAFNLFPISVQINQGHRIRVSLAGADKSMFKRWPMEGTPEWKIHKGGVSASQIKLPYKIIP